jgi:hypothetical protein
MSLSDSCVVGTYGNQFTPSIVDTGIVPGRHTVMTDTLGFDPRTGNQLRLVPEGETRSIKLGNEQINAEWESVTYHFNVEAAKTLLMVRFAVVFQDPGHPQDEQPRFRLEILKGDEDELVEPCAVYDVSAMAGIPGFQTWRGMGTPIVWRDWTTIGLDLSKYVGFSQGIRVRFTTYDCQLGAHFGYAYFTADVLPNDIARWDCRGDDDTVWLIAPLHLESYLWSNGDTTPGTFYVMENHQLITASCLVRSVTGCEFTLNARIYPSMFARDTTIYDTICEGDFPYEHKDYPELNLPKEFDIGPGTTTHTFNYLDLSELCIRKITVILHLTVIQRINRIHDAICFGEDYTENGFEIFLPNVGIHYDTLTFEREGKCDSLVYLTLIVSPSNLSLPETIFGNTTPCSGELEVYSISGAEFFTTFEWFVPENVNLIRGQNTPTITLQFTDEAEADTLKLYVASGCGGDTLRLFIEPKISYYLFEQDLICTGENYEKHGFKIPRQDSAGFFIFSRNLTTTHGCDSIVNLYLYVFPTPDIKIVSSADVICDGDFVKIEVVSQRLFNDPSNDVRIGDIIDGPNESKGIVFWINPEKTKGYAVSLYEHPEAGHYGPNNTMSIPTHSAANAPLDMAFEQNTLAMYEYSSCSSTTDYVACLLGETLEDVVEAGWFIPTVGVWNLIFDILSFINPKMEDFGGTPVNSSYWSSTQTSAVRAFSYNASDGTHLAWNKEVPFKIRTIREFEIPPKITYDTTLTYVWNTGHDITSFVAYPTADFIFTVTAESNVGCASTVSKQIFVSDGTGRTINDAICAGQDYNQNGFNLSASEIAETVPPEFFITLQNGICEVDVTLHLTINDTISSFIDTSFCQGRSFIYNGVIYDSAGNYEQFFNTEHGCDSILNLRLSLKYNVTTTPDTTVCGFYFWEEKEQAYYSSGLFSQIFSATNGCDSIVHKTITILEPKFVNLDLDSCDRVIYDGLTFINDTILYRTLPNDLGCDTFLTVKITVNRSFFGDTVILSDVPVEYPKNSGNWYDQDVILTFNLKTVKGCDSVRKVYIYIPERPICPPVIERWIDSSSCLQVIYNGIPYSKDTLIFDTIRYATRDCDSLIEFVNLTVLTTFPEIVNRFGCDSVMYRNKAYFYDTFFIETLVDGLCETDRHVTLKINRPFRDTLEGIDSLEYPENSGNWYDRNTTLVFLGATATDCDSTIVILICKTTRGLLKLDSCNQVTYKDSVYLVNTIFVDTLVKANHCGADSLLTVEIVVYPLYRDTIVLRDMDSVEYPKGSGIWYDRDTIFNDSLVSLKGCDSIIHVRIFVPIPDCEVFGTLELNPCDRYTYFGNINNGVTFYGDTIFTDSLVSLMGCDSLLYVDISFRFSNTTDTFGQNCLYYAWNDSIYAVSGTYTQIFEATNGCDSVVRKAITILESSRSLLKLDSCNQVTYKDSVYLTNTTLVDTLSVPNQWGCDSIVDIHIFIRECPPHIDTIVVYWHRVLAVQNKQNSEFLRKATYFWHKDGDLIVPQDNKDWIEIGLPIPAGKYHVWIVYDGDSSYAERTFEDEFFGVSLSAYPNPISLSDILSVEAHTKIEDVEITLNGVWQKTENRRISEKSFEISGFKVPGVYILRVIFEQQFDKPNVESIKIVVL